MAQTRPLRIMERTARITADLRWIVETEAPLAVKREAFERINTVFRARSFDLQTLVENLAANSDA